MLKSSLDRERGEGGKEGKETERGGGNEEKEEERGNGKLETREVGKE